MKNFISRWFGPAVVTVILIGGCLIPAWSDLTCTVGAGLCTGSLGGIAKVSIVTALIVTTVFWVREVAYFRRSRNRT